MTLGTDKPSLLRRARATVARVPHWIVSPLGMVMVGLSGVATSSLLSRYLGPVGRGHFTEAMLWTNLLLTGGAFVNVQSVAYYWARGREPDDRSRTMSAALGGAAILCAILVPAAFGVNFLALGITQKPSYFAAKLFVLAIPLGLYSACTLGVLVAERSFVAYWAARLSNVATFLAGLLAIAILDAFDLNTAILSALLGGVVASVISTSIVVKRRSVRMVWSDMALLRPMMVFGAKTSMTSLPYQLNVRLDQVIMSVLLPASQLGFYATAASWSTILSFIGSGLSVVMLSRSIMVRPDDRLQVERLVQQFRVIAWTTLFLGAGAAALAPLGIMLLFGAAFAPSIIPSVVLCFASVILNSNQVLHELSRGLGMPEIGMRAELLSLALTSLLLLLLLRPFGTLGAALISVISYGAVSVSMVVSIRRRLGITVGEMLLPRVSDARLLFNTMRQISALPNRVGGVATS